MLKAIISDTPSEQAWILQGRLCRRWAAVLQEKWESTRSTRIGRTCSVDLEDVTSVDAEGEGVLLEMLTEGAVLHSRRAYMNHVIESLKARSLTPIVNSQSS
jgi:ABC-type transporter Mla MlaB component